MDKYKKYYDFLVKENNKYNLTRILEEDDVYIKHFYDCKKVLEYYDFSNKKVLDVGSGAGFPGVVLKIEENTIDLTMIDSISKKTQFLNNLKIELDLEYNVINDRVENLNKNNKYDIVISRAVARLNILQELCIPYVKKGGYFIAMKGSQAMDEINESLVGIEILGAKLDFIKELDLPNGLGKRYFVFIKKIKETPNIYPRLFNQIKKNPL